MKFKTYLKKSEYRCEQFATKRVWKEETVHEGYRWVYSLRDGVPHRNLEHYRHVWPARWVKRKDYSISWFEASRFYFYPKFKYYRRIHTFAERRDALASPKELIRPARRSKALPNPWDDFPHETVKSWKDTHKCRKQWMKNL